MTDKFNNQFETSIDKRQLKTPRAQRMAQVVCSGDFDGVAFVECRADSNQGLEAVVVNVCVPLGQKDTENNIRSIESVGIVFGSDERLPAVYPLRDDFPFYLPHVNVSHKHLPRSLCLSDQSVDLQIRDYTAIKMLHQIQWWMEKSAYGELHGEEQPLDPMFSASQIQIIAKESVLNATHVVGARTSTQSNAPIALHAISSQELEDSDFDHGFWNLISIETTSVPHGQLNWVPTDLSQLFEVYSESGVDIVMQLQEKLKEVALIGSTQRLLEAPIVLMLSTNVVAKGRRPFLQQKLYLTLKSAGEVGESLGVFERAAGVGWGLIFGEQPPDEMQMTDIEILGADINFELSPGSAAQYSNLASSIDHKLTMIGAGAIGSHFSLAAARGGVGEWHIIDDDFLLPHNLARHSLDPFYRGSSKAEANANVIRSLFSKMQAAKGYVHRISGGEIQDDLLPAFKDTHEVIDASASVTLARQLAFDCNIESPITSVFLTPTGRDGVLLSEDIERTIRLDCIENYYYWMIATNPKLEQHLHEPGQSIPMGGCRTPSARIAETQVGLLSSVMAGRWIKVRQSSSALVNVWCGSGDYGALAHIEETVPEFLTLQAGEWTIKISVEVLDRTTVIKKKVSPLETGGIVVGSWDKLRKVGYIVGVFDAPRDSHHSVHSFVRGSVGVRKAIHELEVVTLGNLAYIGEWHSHPPGASSKPSSDDQLLLSWVGENVEPFEAPAVMLISADEGHRLLCQSGAEVTEVLVPSEAG